MTLGVGHEGEIDNSISSRHKIVLPGRVILERGDRIFGLGEVYMSKI